MKYGEQGERLRQLRDALGLTGWDVAVAVGCKPQSVSNWETGKNRPKLEIAIALGTLYEARDEVLGMYGYVAGEPDTLARLAEAERRLDQQAATIARIVEVLGLTVETVGQGAEPRRRPKS